MVLMSSSLAFLLQHFNFQYHYICLSLSLLFLSIYTLAFSTQMLIQYYTVPLSTPWPNFWHSYYSSAIHSIILPDLYPNTWFDFTTSLSVLCTCLSYSLPSSISANPLAAQFGIIINFLQNLLWTLSSSFSASCRNLHVATHMHFHYHKPYSKLQVHDLASRHMYHFLLFLACRKPQILIKESMMTLERSGNQCPLKWNTVISGNDGGCDVNVFPAEYQGSWHQGLSRCSGIRINLWNEL